MTLRSDGLDVETKVIPRRCVQWKRLYLLCIHNLIFTWYNCILVERKWHYTPQATARIAWYMTYEYVAHREHFPYTTLEARRRSSGVAGTGREQPVRPPPSPSWSWGEVARSQSLQLSFTIAYLMEYLLDLSTRWYISIPTYK